MSSVYIVTQLIQDVGPLCLRIVQRRKLRHIEVKYLGPIVWYLDVPGFRAGGSDLTPTFLTAAVLLPEGWGYLRAQTRAISCLKMLFLSLSLFL